MAPGSPPPPHPGGQRQACAGPLALLAVLNRGQASLIELHPRQGWVRVFSAPPAPGTPALALGWGRERGPCCQAAAVARQAGTRPPCRCWGPAFAVPGTGHMGGAMKGTHGALSASHPRQPHVYCLHPHTQPHSRAHTACTHVQSHARLHTHAHTHTVMLLLHCHPTPCPTPIQYGVLCPSPQWQTLQGGTGQWGAEEAGVTPSTASGSPLLPSCT